VVQAVKAVNGAELFGEDNVLRFTGVPLLIKMVLGL
jgi:hypothetical protein